MSRALAELQAEAQRNDLMPCRIVRLWPNDFPVGEAHRQGFYHAPLDPTHTRPVIEDRIYLGRTLSEAKQNLLNAKLPKQAVTKEDTTPVVKQKATPYKRRRKAYAAS